MRRAMDPLTLLIKQMAHSLGQASEPLFVRRTDGVLPAGEGWTGQLILSPFDRHRVTRETPYTRRPSCQRLVHPTSHARVAAAVSLNKQCSPVGSDKGRCHQQPMLRS